MNKNKLIAVVMMCIIVLNLAGCQSKKSLKNSSDIEKEFFQPGENSSVIETVEFDKETFLSYFEDFPYYFSQPIASTEELKNETIITPLMIITFKEKTSAGYIFETDGDQENIIIPKEMILETAKKLLNINYDIDSFAKGCQFYDEEKLKFVLPSSFSGALMDFEILKESLVYNNESICIKVTFYEFDTNRQKIDKTLLYYFSIVDSNNYQLIKIIKI